MHDLKILTMLPVIFFAEGASLQDMSTIRQSLKAILIQKFKYLIITLDMPTARGTRGGATGGTLRDVASIEWYHCSFASGVYYYRLEAVPVTPQAASVDDPFDRFVRIMSMILLK